MSTQDCRSIPPPFPVAQLPPEPTTRQASLFFSDELRAEQWFIGHRWPNGMACPYCGSVAVVRTPTRKPMPFHCSDCRKYFSVRTGTVMAHSNIPLCDWGLAAYYYHSRPKGISSRQLAQELGVTQKTAWHMLHRLREGGRQIPVKMGGPVEVDEALLGGNEKYKHADKKLHERWYSGKMKIVGMIDRSSNRLIARVTDELETGILQWFIRKNTVDGVRIYSDQAHYYQRLPNHAWVTHSKGEYVRGEVTTNSIESVWALLKRIWRGTYHWYSRKHVQRYLFELEVRHNLRPLTIPGRMSTLVMSMVGRSMSYRELVHGHDGYNGFNLLDELHVTQTQKDQANPQGQY